MHDGSGDANEQVVGVIFPSVGVPSGAFITEARVIFDVDEVRPGMSDKSVTVNIYGEANTNAATPTTTNGDLSNRVPTAAAVTWVPDPSVNAHDDLVTPDIRAIVQEIVDLPGCKCGTFSIANGRVDPLTRKCINIRDSGQQHGYPVWARDGHRLPLGGMRNLVVAC